ncbi:hypothetical protein BH10CHL1_BH10CHL1_48590 [soil metagenome]
MSKIKDLRKQMKKQLKEFEEQIETFGEQADAIEAATLKRSQERLVNLLDGMDAQLKVWQNGMTAVDTKTNGAANQASTPDTGDLANNTFAVWTSMEKQIQQWLTKTATMRMEVGADALWQLETLRTLNTTASEKLRTLKSAQDGSHAVLKEEAENALDDLKHALERVLPD